ncbi:MAG: hypothetical protein L3J03_05175 [Desulfobacterales bacterium]|nr:hypothetical protein [Desulfobacterales bacterium]
MERPLVEEDPFPDRRRFTECLLAGLELLVVPVVARLTILSQGCAMETGKNRLTFWDRIMMAITFAEAGEAATARELLNKRSGKKQRPESRARQEREQRPRLKV